MIPEPDVLTKPVVEEAATTWASMKAATAPHWRLATRIAFRFCFLYFGLYILVTQMFPGMIPGVQAPVFSTLPPIGPTVMWVIRNIFNDTRELQMLGGSGDKMFDWVLVLCLLVFCALITLAWSAIDRRRANYARLNKWFHVYLRFGLATTMVGYGMVKAIPMQMSAPNLTRLLEPFGHFSPMGVLWASIGASFPYERFAGAAELLAAVLLFIPQTAMLGAFVALIDSIQIFALNMTYDVPVKLFSFHLVLMSILLLAPDIGRLLNVFVFNRTAAPSAHHRFGRLAIAGQLALGGFFLWSAYSSNIERWRTAAGGAPRPPLYGVWVIDRMTIDGVERAPLVTDYDRWRRVVIQTASGISFWRMDDTPLPFPAQYDMPQKTVTLTQGLTEPRQTVGRFSIDQPTAERLVLDGVLNGRRIRMETTLFPREKFPLVSRGFSWIQEVPFNR
jgi:hypothetical protein